MNSENKGDFESRNLVKKHYLKTVNPYFLAVWDNLKLFEYRKNDRNFEVNDIVYLQEFDPISQLFSGAVITVKITYILKCFDNLNLDYCIFSFVVLEKRKK
ncbi:hypothetical protein FI166_550132 [Flavobacterium psychrophilum]|uniref:DUF3850 domain-containing protein n=1 Tax=Flavobacterium psychrophilum TaxID=96345 RepID=UPI000B7C1A4D|nr:DUF3850 domain-containing protein [Flavobacterium psychrophilum]SNB21214.1 hypothetical protein FI166_550132 [Flavobacterium psychrophilum]